MSSLQSPLNVQKYHHKKKHQQKHNTLKRVLFAVTSVAIVLFVIQIFQSKYKTLNSTEEALKNELSYFLQFELNENLYKNVINEKKINQKLTYTFSEKSDVQSYEVQLDSFDRVQSIQIISLKDNFYYQSKTIINLNFGLYSETFPLLLSYNVFTDRNILFIGNEKLSISTKINASTN